MLNLEAPVNRPQYVLEILVDSPGEAYPSAGDGTDEIVALLDRLVIKAHNRDDDTQVSMAYDSGTGKGYIGFSESIRGVHGRSLLPRSA